MRIQERHLFSKGQFRNALTLTPECIQVRYRVVAAIAGIALLALSSYLWSLENPDIEIFITALGFGIISLAFAIFKASYEVIQEQEIRMRLSLGPLSFIVSKTPLHSGFIFAIEVNSTKEIMVIANQGSPKQMSIGPFDSRVQAEEILERLQSLDLDLESPRHEDQKLARAKKEIAGIAPDSTPFLPRIVQVVWISLILLFGLTSDSPDSPLIFTFLLIFGIVVCEALIISTTIIEKISPDYQFVAFSQRHRFFWKETYYQDPLWPDSLSYRGRTINQRAFTPVILFTIGYILLNFRSAPPKDPPRQLQAPTEISESDREAMEKGIEILNKAKELRDQQEREQDNANHSATD